MSIDECLAQYTGYMQQIFHAEHGKVGKVASLALHGSYYPAHVLEKVVKDIVPKQLGDENAPLVGEQPKYKLGDKQCKM